MMFVWLVGCGGGAATEKSDQDGDGVADAADCAPDDRSIHPGAAEVCDGVDNNCDLLVDEGLPTELALPDADGDGFGDDARGVAACSLPAGSVATGGDCDDDDPSSFPGAPERCDGVDHDCDGALNEDDATDAIPWAVDADGDGYGGAEVVTACTIGEGLSGRDDDCDDTDPAIHPDAGETCEADGIDQDCDGLLDDEDPDAPEGGTWYRDVDGDGDGAGDALPASACSPPAGYSLTGTDCDDNDPELYTRGWYADADADGYGDGSAPTWSCEPVDGLGTDGRDCDDAEPAIHPGARDLCDDGIDSDCNGEDCFLTLVDVGATAGDSIGFLFTVGDFDGDGALDLAETRWSDAGYKGTVRTYAGPIDGPVGAPVSLLTGTDRTDNFGGLTGAGDLDGDGDDELFATGLGARLVFEGPLPVKGFDTDAAGSWVSSRSTLPSWDVDLAGDLDGDGADDLVVGEWAGSDGAVRIIPRAIPAPDTNLGSIDVATIRPAGGINAVGWAQAGSQDFDGDGQADLLAVGGLDASHPILGYTMIFHGPLSGTIDADTADVIVNTVDEGYWLFAGWAWATPDLDNDGYAEALVMSEPDIWRFDGMRPGQYDSRGRTGILQDVAPDSMASLVTGELGGTSDLDVAIGAPYATSTEQGAVYIFDGPLAGTVASTDARATWYGEREGDSLGECVRSLGDTEGVGLDSLLVGSSWYEREPGLVGAIHLIRGSELP